MAQFRYKAYISYSHKDHDWAAWLHRALESYRVPSSVRRSEPAGDEVPARIRPVFRDRDDLSSATDLKETVKQALTQSENLVVLCSPEAAGSRWVNEEIRLFAERADKGRIFCVIVSGDQEDDDDVSGVFPAALAEIGLTEPLAADARRWADGKHLAMLKVAAALLGVRLDELRQRDLQRRRQRRLITALGIVAAVILVGMTIIARVSQEFQRERAEQLATFIVDLGERLRSDVDLETLAVINTEAMAYLEDLDLNDLSPEAARRVALSLRQMGRISQAQGRPEEALEAFQRSHEVLSLERQAHPELTDVLFELGNAEYYIGNLHFEQGRHEEAVHSMTNYFHLAQELYETDPQNPDWVLELSYAHTNLAALQLGGAWGVDEETLMHVNEAIRLKEQLLSMKPGDKGVRKSYANSLAWAADAQYQACNLDNALQLRIEASDFAEQSMNADPGDNELRRRYAYTLTGVARIRIAQGHLENDAGELRQAISLLQQLSAADPSNMVYREEALYRKVMLARWLADTGRAGQAQAMLQEMETGFMSMIDDKDEEGLKLQYVVEFLLTRAEVEQQMGSIESAHHDLKMILQLHAGRATAWPSDMYARHRLARLKYLWWKINGAVDFDGFPSLQNSSREIGDEIRSCTEADTTVRTQVLAGKHEAAAENVSYLLSRGYADPGFMRFCRENGLCETG